MKELLEAVKVLREEDWEVYDDDLTLEKSDLIINIGKRGHIEWELQPLERRAIGNNGH